MPNWVPGVALAGLAIFLAIGPTLPLIGKGKGALWLLVILGFFAHGAICTTDQIPGRPMIAVGVILGVSALVLTIVVSVKKSPKFVRAAIVTLAAIITVKVSIATALMLSAVG